MSRAYRVTVKGSVHRVVHVEDGVCTSLELLPILPQERTGEILGAELARRGFAVENSVAPPVPPNRSSLTQFDPNVERSDAPTV